MGEMKLYARRFTHRGGQCHELKGYHAVGIRTPDGHGIELSARQSGGYANPVERIVLSTDGTLFGLRPEAANVVEVRLDAEGYRGNTDLIEDAGLDARSAAVDACERLRQVASGIHHSAESTARQVDRRDLSAEMVNLVDVILKAIS